MGRESSFREGLRSNLLDRFLLLLSPSRPNSPSISSSRMDEASLNKLKIPDLKAKCKEVSPPPRLLHPSPKGEAHHPHLSFPLVLLPLFSPAWDHRNLQTQQASSCSEASRPSSRNYVLFLSSSSSTCSTSPASIFVLLGSSSTSVLVSTSSFDCDPVHRSS